jgi:hypothetical protein
MYSKARQLHILLFLVVGLQAAMFDFEMPQAPLREHQWSRICSVYRRILLGIHNGLSNHGRHSYPRQLELWVGARRPDKGVALVGW